MHINNLASIHIILLHFLPKYGPYAVVTLTLRKMANPPGRR